MKHNKDKKDFKFKILFFSILFSISFAASDTLSVNSWYFKFTGIDPATYYFNGKFPRYEFEKITIPHSYNLNEGLGGHKVGYGIYITDLEYNFKSNVKYIMKFGRVCLRAKIFIDGVQAAESNHPYLPFEFDISQFVRNKKKISIAVQVNNRLLENDIPDNNCDGWWIYGGILGNVTIVQSKDESIEKVQVRTFFINDSTFKLSVDYKVLQTIPDSCSLLITNSAENFHFQKMLYNSAVGSCISISGIRAWTPNNPVLYEFQFIPYFGKLKGKSFHTIKRGFTQLSKNGTQLLLNGKPIYLRGIGRHDVIKNESPFLTYKQRLDDLLKIKAANANLLRIAHYPQDESIYRICDSIGLLVIDEIPVWQTDPGFICTSEGINLAEDYLQKLIAAHGNFTSIILWSIGNEFHSEKSNVTNFVKSVTNYVKHADPSRMVTYASYYYQFDKSYEFADVISVNEYLGWYLGAITMIPNLLKSIHNMCPTKPIIITEFGASAALGKRNSDVELAGIVTSMISKDYSEDFQALFHQSQIEKIWSTRGICSGAIVWCFNDFMENRKKPNPDDLKPGINGMGIVTTDRKEKLSYKIIQEKFKEIQLEMRNTNGY